MNSGDRLSILISFAAFPVVLLLFKEYFGGSALLPDSELFLDLTLFSIIFLWFYWDRKASVLSPVGINIEPGMNMTLYQNHLNIQHRKTPAKIGVKNRSIYKKYQSLCANAQVGMVRFDANTCKIIEVNQKAASIYGYKNISELKGMHLDKLLNKPLSLDQFIEQIKQDLVISHYVFEGLSMKQTVLQLELFARYEKHSHEIEANFLDITEQRSMENKAAFQSYLLDNVQRSIVVIDPEGTIIYYNQEAANLFSIHRDTIPMLNLPFNKMQLNTIAAHVLQGNNWETEQYLFVNGIKRKYSHHIHPLTRNGEIECIVIISTDISDLTEARRNAEIANLVKSQFLANISHELRTPMIGILAAVDLLEEGNLEPEQAEHIRTIKDCSEQLLGTINEMLEASKIDLGLMTVNPSPVSVHEILRKSGSLIESNLWGKGLHMDITIEPSFPPMVMLDELKIRQILANLLSNAIKFTYSGMIGLEAWVEEADADGDAMIVFSVSDTGIGIPAEKLSSVFDLFTQGDGSNRREFSGTGLGLYTCKRLVELLSGEIDINSQVGTGTTVTFRVPLQIHHADTLVLDEAPLQEAAAESTCFIHDFAPISILLVEDNLLNQKLIGRMLLNYGFDISTANNGLECLDLLQRESYDLILMDMQMPIMDGYETSRMIRSTPGFNHIPIIAITAHAMSGDCQKCLDSGCNAYLAKPFKTEALLQEISRQLSQPFVRKESSLETRQIINELLPEFLDILHEMLDDLLGCIDKRNWPGIQNAAHAIKGTAGMYGFMQISECAAAIEKAGNDHNAAKLDTLCIQIKAMCKELTSRSNTQTIG